MHGQPDIKFYKRASNEGILIPLMNVVMQVVEYCEQTCAFAYCGASFPVLLNSGEASYYCSGCDNSVHIALKKRQCMPSGGHPYSCCHVYRKDCVIKKIVICIM
jgi:hypothetical protein